MFQYEFFSLKNFILHKPPRTRRPDCFLQLKDIQWIRSSYWAEHCLECGEPLCYETCRNYIPRADKRCRLFRYGIYPNPFFSNCLYSAEVSFRKWGKMESIVYPGSFTPQRAEEIHKEWKKRCIKKSILTHLGSYGLKRFPVNARRKFDSAKYTVATKESAGNQQDTPQFLLQLFSYEKQSFTLFFDVTDDADLAFRESITIYPGYNQYCLDVSTLFPPKGKLRAKFYPADNAEVTVVFLFCEFIKLYPYVIPQNYPSSSLNKATDLKPADKVKCIAWDLDNTIWDGILIESNPDTLQPRSGVLETIQELDQRGIIQIIVSKNSEEDVLPVLKRLDIEKYFVYIFANWNAKSMNLKSAAQLLNIGINSFALIDDSAFERNEVCYELPSVRVYDETVVSPTFLTSILSKQEFDVPVTEDSKARREMYQTEARRKTAAKNNAGNNIDFLKSCNLTAILDTPSTEDEILRCFELLQRTNQLNLSGNKYEYDDFCNHLLSEQFDSFILKCKDRFGSYGQVAYFETKLDKTAHVLHITEFAMSCRVASKYVESALINSLFDYYKNDNVMQIELHGNTTSRNGLLVQTFISMGFENVSKETAIHLTCKDRNQLNNTDVVQIIVNTNRI